MLTEMCVSLKNMGEKNVASELIKALARHSQAIEQFDMLAMSAYKISDFMLAIDLSEKCLTLSKDPKQTYDIKENLANSYVHANYPEKCLDLIKEMEEVLPMDRDRELKKAYALFLLTKRDEAEAILKKNLEDPNITDKIKTQIEFNLGTYEMYRDNFQEGLFRFLHYGRKMGTWPSLELPFKKWDGEDIAGKRLIIRSEAGIGDELINVRFMKHLKDSGVTPLWFTDRGDIRNIVKDSGFDTIPSVKNIIDNGDVYWCYSMNLPLLLNLSYADLWYGPYLKTNDAIRLPDSLNTDKEKIGIRWQGNIHYENDLHRSLNLKDIYDVVKDRDAQLYSLQRDDGVNDVYEFSDIVPLHESYMWTFDETLMAISKMDIVITSCTSIAHAAAAMDKRTFVFVPISAYYPWCNSWGERSPWYGENTTVLRQTKPRCWKEPLQRLGEILKQSISH